MDIKKIMKKKVQGILAIIIAFCVVFSGLPLLAGGLDVQAASKKKQHRKLP
jgi:hypothetical protein